MGGKGAERLGLQGDVRRKDFIALASNKRPGTDETLTVRMKTTRREAELVFDEKTNTWKQTGGEVSNRAGYDFCFSVPKSVSLYLVETGDKIVERKIHESFGETMLEWLDGEGTLDRIVGCVMTCSLQATGRCFSRGCKPRFWSMDENPMSPSRRYLPACENFRSGIARSSICLTSIRT